MFWGCLTQEWQGFYTAIRSGYVSNYFLGQSCFEINLKSLLMVVFATSLRFSLVNACVSNSPLILSRDNLCCLIYLCLRTMNKCIFVLEAQKWVREGEFFQIWCIPLSVPLQRFFHAPCALFLAPRPGYVPCTSTVTPLKSLDVCKLHWERHLRSSGMHMSFGGKKKMKQIGG